jgi:hypothetical protein
MKDSFLHLSTYLENLIMKRSPFKEINPATCRVWKLSELWEERQRLSKRISYLESVLEQKKEQEDLLTNEQFINHCKAGLKIHNKEFALAVRDVKDLGVLARKQVVKLPKFSQILTNNFSFLIKKA